MNKLYSKSGWWLLAALLVALGAGLARRLPRLGAAKPEVPTARVRRGNLTVRVYVLGELQAAKTAMLTAPSVNGTLQIIRLLPTGSSVKSGETVIEFDPAEQEFNLEQSRSEVDEEYQDIAKAEADAAVQTAKDKVDLLKARYALRQAQLEVTKNELLSAIDAKKNLLALDEAQRALEQTEQDVKSHTASNQAGIELAREKREKARQAMERAAQNLKSMKVTSPIDGLVSVHSNPQAFGGIIFSGVPMPDYREGDQVYAGSMIAQVLDPAHMEIRARVDEADRALVSPGQSVRVRLDALAGQIFTGKVKTVAGAAVQNFWSSSGVQKFDVTFELNQPDDRLRPGLTAQVVVRGNDAHNVLLIPRQALFDENGKSVVYVRDGDGFKSQPVKVTRATESQVAIEGAREGAEVALVNPKNTIAGRASASRSPMLPGAGGGL